MNEFFKKHTYSQLFLMGLASAELYKVDADGEGDDGSNFDDYTGDEYLNHLKQGGML